MGKTNKIITFLLCVLIVLSAANLFLGVTNSYRIKQLESAPPVIIEKDTQLSISLLATNTKDKLHEDCQEQTAGTLYTDFSSLFHEYTA